MLWPFRENTVGYTEARPRGKGGGYNFSKREDAMIDISASALKIYNSHEGIGVDRCTTDSTAPCKLFLYQTILIKKPCLFYSPAWLLNPTLKQPLAVWSGTIKHLIAVPLPTVSSWSPGRTSENSKTQSTFILLLQWTQIALYGVLLDFLTIV